MIQVVRIASPPNARHRRIGTRNDRHRFQHGGADGTFGGFDQDFGAEGVEGGYSLELVSRCEGGEVEMKGR